MRRLMVAAIGALPIVAFSLLPKPATAAMEFQRPLPSSVVVADRPDDTDRRDTNRRDNNDRNRDWRNRDGRDRNNQRDWRDRDGRDRNDQRDTNTRYDDRHRDDSNWRNGDRRDNNRRVWIPGHWESGFLGIGRKWVEGHYETR